MDDQSDNASGYRFLYSTDGGSTWTEIVDLAGSTSNPITHTATLPGGERYELKGEVYTEHTTSETNTVTIVDEDGVVTEGTATSTQLNEIASGTLSVATTEVSAATIATETGLTTVGANITPVDAASFVTERSIANEGNMIVELVATTFVTDIARATETNLYVDTAADTTVSELARAIEDSVFTGAVAETTIIYLPPIPRMGLDVNEQTGELHHGVEDWDK